MLIKMISDTDNKEQTKNFFTSEYTAAHNEHQMSMRKVTAARNRVERKKELADGNYTGPAMDIDDLVNRSSMEDLQVLTASKMLKHGS